MSGFSTIVDGTIVSPLRFNYDVSVSASGTIPATYTAAGITDTSGLQVVIFNSSGSNVVLTATSISNHASYPVGTTTTSVTILPNNTVTLITEITGSTYTVSAVSLPNGLSGGSAGELLYQSATDVSDFLPVAASGNYLLSNGAGVAPSWSPFLAQNLAGGTAGSVDFQFGPNVTVNTGAGSTPTSSNANLIGSNAGTPIWTNATFYNGYNNTYAAGTLTVRSPRGYTISMTTLAPYGFNLPNYLAAANIPDLAGNTYLIYNDTGANSNNITVNGIQNRASYSPSAVPTSVNITVYKNESVYLQTYNPGSYTINSMTQSQQWGGFYGIANQSLSSTNTPLVLTPLNDPNSWWGGSGANNIISPNRAGYYLITLAFGKSMVNIVGGFENDYILVNGIIVAQQSQNQGAQTSRVTQAIVYLNGSTDYIQISYDCRNPADQRWTSTAAMNVAVSLLF